ncbi:orotidine-5'-phosphate decarboxylase [Lysinibacillus telephonicus]|uniref:orotidine-5'-phosphate decarboxylase n=1 Tax=Lysinibacillus telephonicus TaxID=1714840 RepID=UPI00397D5288
MFNFSDLIIQNVKMKKSHVVVGIDPDINRIPLFYLKEAESLYGVSSQGAAHALLEFGKTVINTVKDYVAVVKLQSAYFEVYGAYGVATFWELVSHAKNEGLIVIADAKRGDIGPTSRAYSESFFGDKTNKWRDSNPTVDALTINPYLGKDSIDPFYNSAISLKKGLFILVKTSNNSSEDLQDKQLKSQLTVSETIAEWVNKFACDSIGENGYSLLGAVVGATHTKDILKFRKLMPNSIFLLPGYGAQGGKGENITNAFNPDGYGALISASRSIIYSYDKEEIKTEHQIKKCITDAVRNMNNDINDALLRENKLKWKAEALNSRH